MLGLEHHFRWLSSRENFVSEKDDEDKVIVFERNNLLFIFNFHPTKVLTSRLLFKSRLICVLNALQSYENYKIGTSIR